MLNEQEKREFVLSTIRPMADHTSPCLTQVIGVIDGQTGEFRGTGFFCKVAQSEAIITAGHVLRDAAKTGRFRSLAFSRGLEAPPTIVAGLIYYSDEFDLAIYLPERPFPLAKSKVFWPEQRIDRSGEMISKDYLFIQGFPGRYSRFTTLGGRTIISEPLAYGAMMRYRQEDVPEGERAQFLDQMPDYEFLPDGFLKPFEFALNFSTLPASFLEIDGKDFEGRPHLIDDWSELFQDGETFPGQKPKGAYGLSGSPVWRIGAAGRSVGEWTPESSELIGVITRWDEGQKILIATKIAAVFDVIDSRS